VYGVGTIDIVIASLADHSHVQRGSGDIQKGIVTGEVGAVVEYVAKVYDASLENPLIAQD
jgi:hypothetical protein